MSERPASIFVSYARADRQRVEQLIAALEGAGHEVWWDGLIEAGEAFARTIEGRLDAVDVVLAVWSRASIQSDWVRDEAAHGRDRRRFVAVALDGSLPPLGFRQYHAGDLAAWQGDAGAPAFAALRRAIDLARRGERVTLPVPLPRTLPRRAVLAGGGAVAVAAGGIALWHPWSPAPVDNSIAVLPFRNLSGDAAQSYFSDGLAEEIRGRLASDAHLSVAAPTSSNLFRDGTEDARVVAGKLGVAWLLEGTVARQDGTVRVTAALIEGARGMTRWSQSFDRPLKDVFAVEGEVAGEVATALAGQVGGKRAAPGEVGGTADAQAHDLYLQAKALYDLDKDGDTYQQAATLIATALEADPAYARAYVLQSRILMVIRNGYTTSIAEMQALYARSLAAVRKAMALAPGLASAHMALAYAMLAENLNFPDVMAGYQRGFTLGQGDADIALSYANVMYKAGHYDMALAAIETSQTRDPLNPIVFRIHAMILSFMRQADKAMPLFAKAMALNPRLALVQAGVGDLHLAAGRFDAALAAYRAESNAAFRLAGVASAQARLGDRAGSDATMAQLVRELGDTGMFQQAQIHAQRGDPEAAIAALERAFTFKDAGLLLLGGDIKLDPLRKRPDFGKLLARMGLA